MNLRLLFTITFLFLYAHILFAQSKIKKSNAVIRIIARPIKDSSAINIRWAVSNARAWKLCNQYGFILERFTILRNKKMLTNPEKKILSPLPLKPKPLAQWEMLAKKDNYAAVIAQSIYGQRFQVTGDEAGGIAKIMAQSQELEQRFVFSLYSADMSFEGAKMAGWGFTDRDIKPNEKYFYRIKTALPPKMLKT